MVHEEVPVVAGREAPRNATCVDGRPNAANRSPFALSIRSAPPVMSVVRDAPAEYLTHFATYAACSVAADMHGCRGRCATHARTVSALFRTSLACAPQATVAEPDVDVEPLSPRRAASKTASELSPFARVVLRPPTLVLVLDQTPSLSAVTEISNTGGIKGTFHVCKDSLPGWISLDGSERGELEPGEKVEIAIVIDAAEAEAAARKESNNDSESDTHRPAACAVLRVEVDGGGSGTMLPVVCNLGDR